MGDTPISDKGDVRSDVRNPAHRVPPHNIDALTSAGFNIVSYAGNNNLDYGIAAFEDTLERLTANNIQYFGAGDNLEDARRPLYTDVNGVKIAWLNFCSILRDGFAATSNRPGISPLRVKTFYEPLENIYEQPGTPSRTITVADAEDLEAAMAMIREARQNADIVIGCFHWGVHFTHDLAQYQVDVGYAAIDNGCDLVLGTHPHCLQAVDLYKGKYIFYSLGNFAFEQPEAIAQHGVGEYLSFYDIPIEPDLKVHPHPRHCRKTILVKIEILDKKISAVRFVPVYFSNRARPEVQRSTDPLFEEIMGLMDELCREIGTCVTYDGNEATVMKANGANIDVRGLLSKRKLSYPWLRRLAQSSDLSQT